MDSDAILTPLGQFARPENSSGTMDWQESWVLGLALNKEGVKS